MSSKIENIKSIIKKYLSLENVSFLTGAGTSFHLGAPIIRDIPEPLKDVCKDAISDYFEDGVNPSYEDLYNCLQADRFLRDKKGDDLTQIDSEMQEMQKWLYDNCNTNKTNIHSLYETDVHMKDNRYYYHEKFVKKILQRPNNLKRANIFTTNYDMAFDYALDNLGVHYINGFAGVHNRYFKPEVYDYDLYYPGHSVSGKVHRAEKVIRYYKIHGSLSWISTIPSIPSIPSINNPYGIQEIALGSEFKCEERQELMIYPCVSKKSFTLDLPYSELFRHFAQTIIQPQSVLICVGYSFNDEHINDIIYQALSIPSFTLIIANYTPNGSPKNDKIDELKALNDNRIIVLDESSTKHSTFVGFTENILPDLFDEEEEAMIQATRRKTYFTGCGVEESE